MSQGQPFAREHCSTSRYPPLAAFRQAFSSKGQPLDLYYSITSRCPSPAASVHVPNLQGAPFFQHYSSTRNCLNLAVDSYQGQPLALHHCSMVRSPLLPDARAAHIPHTPASHGHPLAMRHEVTCKCPPSAAASYVPSSQVQPDPTHHRSIIKCPALAVFLQVPALAIDLPFALNHRSTSIWLPFPAARATSLSSWRQPFDIHHCSAGRCPPMAAYLTA